MCSLIRTKNVNTFNAPGQSASNRVLAFIIQSNIQRAFRSCQQLLAMGSGSDGSTIARRAASPRGHGPVLVMRMALVFVLVVLLLSVSVIVVNAESVANIVSRSFFDSILNAPIPTPTPILANCSCAIGLCCSKWGCGTTSPYCGDGCQSGLCSNQSGESSTGAGTIISSSFFDGLVGGAGGSCEGKGFYKYKAFVTASSAYSGFGTTGSKDVKKRELAATGGLCYINEVAPASIYCDSSITLPCVSGKSYHSRGPLQLSWNYNYEPAGADIGFDGLYNPEDVALDTLIPFMTAVWFWMKNSNCHSGITSGQGFGATIEAINSME